MCTLKRFIKSYWEYYLELETQFIETKRFVAFDISNSKTFSVEYLKLYQAVCSEIDVVGKEIASSMNSNFKVTNDTNIKKWGYQVQRAFPTLKDTIICFDDVEDIQPFKNWEYELAPTKNNPHNLRIVDNKRTIQWWTNYNKVKHRRIGLIAGTKNFELANQRNLILAFSALFLLEKMYIKYLLTKDTQDIEESKLFKIIEGNSETVSDVEIKDN